MFRIGTVTTGAMRVDSTRMVKELGWKPAITRDNFDDGLKDTISWYKGHEDWWRLF